MQYKTRGTCSQLINLELDGDVIKSVEFIGGCDGNLQGISKLVTGMKAEANILSGPARKSTSSGIGTVSIHKYV